MSSDAVRITAEPRTVRLVWSMFSGQLALKIAISLLFASPILCILPLGVLRVSLVDASACLGVVAALGGLMWLLIAGTVEVRIDERGLTRAVRRPLWFVDRRITAAPIDVRLAPLFGTSNAPGGAPSQFMVVFASSDRPFAPIENLVISELDAARLKEAFVRAAVPGVTFLHNTNIEDETRSDCRVCGYDLIGSATAAKCPECGEAIDAGHQRSLTRLYDLRHGRGSTNPGANRT